MKKIISILVSFLIATNAFAAVKPYSGKVTVTTAGTAVALAATSTPFYDAIICANSGNTGIITIGGSAVVGAVATRQGASLAAGACLTLSPTQEYVSGDLANYYADAATNGDKVHYFYRAQS